MKKKNTSGLKMALDMRLIISLTRVIPRTSCLCARVAVRAIPKGFAMALMKRKKGLGVRAGSARSKKIELRKNSIVNQSVAKH